MMQAYIQARVYIDAQKYLLQTPTPDSINPLNSVWD